MKHVPASFRAFVTQRADGIAYSGLVVALIGYVLLAWHKLSYWSIWFDEAFSAYLTRFSYIGIAKYTSDDVHPPLFYWALKGWTSLFGWSDVSFRSLSIAFAVVAIIFAFLLAKRAFGRRVAAVVAFCLALSPMLIRYGQEARMYTMVAAIALAGTYAFVIAQGSKRKLPWVVYAILVAMGMWTHYFSALVWLAHWLWRGIVVWHRSKQHSWHAFRKRYFTKTWLFTYGLAVGLYLPWLPFMVKQLGVVQANGFWIAAVGVGTFTDYLTEFFLYLEQSLVNSWLAVLFFAEVTALIVMLVWCIRHAHTAHKKPLWLVMSCAFTPVVLLFVASLPPLTSSFVGRYLMPSQVCLSLLIGYVLVYYHGTWNKVLRYGVAVGFVVMSVIGIMSVYHYGNYNKNAHTYVQTKFIVQEVQRRASPGVPIVADTPWTFYEASFYSTKDNPIYFLNQSTRYEYGSLVMLRDNDWHKIKDATEFGRRHPEIWYIGSNESKLTSPTPTWRATGESITLTDPIDHRSLSQAIRLTTK